MRLGSLSMVLVTFAACQRTPQKPVQPDASPADVNVVALPEVHSPVAATLLGPQNNSQELFQKYCALCHGKNAEGYAADNAPSLVTASFRATATQEFLRTAIQRGRPGTAMAGYDRALGGPLTQQEVDQLIQFIQREAPPKPGPRAIFLPPQPARGDQKHGEQLFTEKCATCHGTPGQRRSAVHLFNPQFLASASDEFLRYAIVNGREGTPMQGWAGKLAPQDMEDILFFLRSKAVSVPSAPLPAGMEPGAVLEGPIVLNPNGKTPEFHLKDDRLAPLEEVAAAYKAKQRMVIVDARAPSDFNRLHIPGAIPVPYYDPKGLDQVPNDGTWVIAYCACPHHASGAIVDELRKRGYKHTAVLDEGIFAWKTKGHPVAEAPNQLPTPAPPLLEQARQKPLPPGHPAPVPGLGDPPPFHQPIAVPPLKK